MHATGALPLYIPSPPVNGFHIGPLDLHYYALGYIVGIIFAVLITRRRWAALGGDPDVVLDIALWVVPAGIIGGRIYFDITTPQDISPHAWYGVFAVWTGGLGIWGGVLLATLVGAWRLRKMGITVGPFANAIAPALLVAQGVGRIGNYFNKELFGKPTTLPWGLEIPSVYRPSGFGQFATFQPTFLYELIWDVALAVLLIWIGRRFTIKPWGLFALYVAGYSAFRILEESLRIDSSNYFLGLRLNFFVALFGTVAGLTWFVLAQRRPARPVVIRPPSPDDAPSAGASAPEASAAEGAGTEAFGAEAAGTEGAGTEAAGAESAGEPEPETAAPIRSEESTK